MPDLAQLAPPAARPPTGPPAGHPHREQAVVSCALLGYWTTPGPDTAQAYRHRLGLHADLDHHNPHTDTASVWVAGTAIGTLLAELIGLHIDDRAITVTDDADGIHLHVPDPGAPTWSTWPLHAEPDGRYDLAATGELWYPVPTNACDRIAA